MNVGKAIGGATPDEDAAREDALKPDSYPALRRALGNDDQALTELADLVSAAIRATVVTMASRVTWQEQRDAQDARANKR